MIGTVTSKLIQPDALNSEHFSLERIVDMAPDPLLLDSPCVVSEIPPGG